MKKPFSYHQQVAHLKLAQAFIEKAMAELDKCAAHEREHHQEEGAQEYDALTQRVGETLLGVGNFEAAVLALAQHQPPDLVEPFDPTDYSQDERFQQMIDHAFDVAAGHGVEPQEVVAALGAAVAEGDQR